MIHVTMNVRMTQHRNVLCVMSTADASVRPAATNRWFVEGYECVHDMDNILLEKLGADEQVCMSALLYVRVCVAQPRAVEDCN